MYGNHYLFINCEMTVVKRFFDMLYLKLHHPYLSFFFKFQFNMLSEFLVARSRHLVSRRNFKIFRFKPVRYYFTLTLLEPKVIGLCYQYRARPTCKSMQSDQALYCWLTRFKFSSWISLKTIGEFQKWNVDQSIYENQKVRDKILLS